jgi:methionyl-tRNA formyltransferase
VPPPLRVGYAGTPAFAVPPLEALVGASLAPVVVLTQPDRPAGRGRAPAASPVKAAALAHDLPVWQPETLKTSEARERLAACRLDLLVVAAYGLILPKRVLAVPRLGCVNVHASLLPRWRGAAPIQYAILAGDAETGVSIMQMEAGLDTGPVWLSRGIAIGPGETAGELHDRLAPLGAEALMAALPAIVERRPEPVAQDEALATYAPKIDKSEAAVDWVRPAAEIARRIRAFNPWPVCETRAGDARIRLWRASAGAGAGAEPGTVVDESDAGIVIAAGEGVVRVTELQWPGRRRMSAAEFRAGRSLLGRRLG